jgi:hypothetical protein
MESSHYPVLHVEVEVDVDFAVAADIAPSCGRRRLGALARLAEPIDSPRLVEADDSCRIDGFRRLCRPSLRRLCRPSLRRLCRPGLRRRWRRLVRRPWRRGRGGRHIDGRCFGCSGRGWRRLDVAVRQQTAGDQPERRPKGRHFEKSPSPNPPDHRHHCTGLYPHLCAETSACCLTVMTRSTDCTTILLKLSVAARCVFCFFLAAMRHGLFGRAPDFLSPFRIHGDKLVPRRRERRRIGRCRSCR